METKKVIVNGKEIDLITKIDEDMIEKNEYFFNDLEDTLDLSPVINNIDMEDDKNE